MATCCRGRGQSPTLDRKLPVGGGAGRLFCRVFGEVLRGYGAAAGCEEIVGGIESQVKHTDSSSTYFVDKMFFTESENKTVIWPGG